MAIKVNNITVIGDTRQLSNVASIDSVTKTTILGGIQADLEVAVADAVATEIAPIEGRVEGLEQFESDVSSQSGSSFVGFRQDGIGAVTRTAQDKLRDWVHVDDFGADRTGDADSSSAFTAAFASAVTVVAPGGTYKLANVSIPAGRVLFAPGATFIKGANGHIFDLGARSDILGGSTFDGAADAGRTGYSVRISTGENTSTLSLQGHQKIVGATFRNSESYHVAYTVANRGWMSRLIECRFLSKPLNAPANVLWPDEAAIGGNRHIIGGYSHGPVVDVQGADNGIIQQVVIGVGGTDPNNQGVVFPAGTTNPAKKIIITGNRLAYGTNKMTVRGVDHVIKDNICAGGIELAGGVQGCIVGPNLYATTNGFTDNSGDVNSVFENKRFFTPADVSGITVGDGQWSAEYVREGEYVFFRADLLFGTTTSVDGAISMGLPVPVVSGGTRQFLGSCFVGGYVGAAVITQADNRVTLYNAATLSVWNATVPKTWAAGDVLTIQGKYRI